MPLRLNVPAPISPRTYLRDSRDVDMLDAAAQKKRVGWSAADCLDWRRLTALPRRAIVTRFI